MRTRDRGDSVSADLLARNPPVPVVVVQDERIVPGPGRRCGRGASPRGGRHGTDNGLERRALTAGEDTIAARARENPKRFHVYASHLVGWPPRRFEIFEREGGNIQGVLDAARGRFGDSAVTVGDSADQTGRYTGLKISFEYIPDISDFEWLGVEMPASVARITDQ